MIAIRRAFQRSGLRNQIGLTLSYEVCFGILKSSSRSMQIELACMNLRDKMPACTSSTEHIGSSIRLTRQFFLMIYTTRRLGRRCRICRNGRVASMLRDAPMPCQQISTCESRPTSTPVSFSLVSLDRLIIATLLEAATDAFGDVF
jgi:hypothetical protein